MRRGRSVPGPRRRALRAGAACLALAAAVALTGCGGGGGDGGGPPTEPDPPPEPVDGELAVELTTPEPDDGGILFTLSGASVDTVVSLVDGYARASASGGTWTVLITGRLTGGEIAEVRVPDLEAAEAGLEATVEQVAARESWEQRDPAGYSLELVPR